MTEVLSDEIWMQILSWVPPLDVLQSVARVSRHLSSVVDSEAFWKSQTECLVKHWDDNNKENDLSFLNVHQLQRACIYGASAAPEERPVPACLNFGSLFVSQHQALSCRNNYNYRMTRPNDFSFGMRRVCIASSSHHRFEMLENVLAPGKNRWWCSRPSRDSSSSDTLLFATKYPLAIFTKLYIRPMAYPYSGDRIFTWRETEIKAYQLPLNKLALNPCAPRAGFPCILSTPGLPASDITRLEAPVVVDSERERESLAMLLNDEVPVYKSGKIPVQNRSYTVGEGLVSALPEIFELPNVVANVISVTLIGKDIQEPGTNDYYTGVEHVDLVGVPLLRLPKEQAFVSRGISNDDAEDFDSDW